MSLRPYRDLVDGHRDERDAAVADVLSKAPDEPLLRIAWLTAIYDALSPALDEAVADARSKGLSWAAIAIAHDRSAGTTQRKFARRI